MNKTVFTRSAIFVSTWISFNDLDSKIQCSKPDLNNTNEQNDLFPLHFFNSLPNLEQLTQTTILIAFDKKKKIKALFLNKRSTVE